MPSYAYAARYIYTDTVTRNDNLLRISAYHDLYQTPLMSEVATDPASALNEFRDAFGNSSHYSTLTFAHRELTILSVGKVLLKRPPAPGEISLNAVEYDVPSRRYLEASPLVKPEEVTADARQIAQDGLGLLETVGTVVDWVHANIRYERGATSVATSAEYILETRTGVCQDMTQLAIALLRALGIPTRYVSGLLATQEGETHAWIEFLHPSLGWLPADPTRGHRLSVDDDLIKFAIGMDYTQASPVEGTFVSPGTGHLDIAVGKALPDDLTPSLEDARNLIRNPANI